MSFLLSIVITMILMAGGTELLNVSWDHLLLLMAIIFAGGLASLKD